MSNSLYSKRLHQAIPGGAHTYSRGDDQFPSNAPAILEKGVGSYVWDPMGNKFLDYGMGLRSVNIGYGNPEVAEAVYQEVLKGNNLTRATTTELAAAELLIDTIPAVEMVKFAKHGSTVTTAALKLARAYTGKKYVCIPRQHPFFSYDDWFIGSTPLKRGIPEEYRQLTLHFDYNDISSLERLFDQYKGEIAAVMLEPASLEGPCPADHKQGVSGCEDCASGGENFLHKVQKACQKNGAVFILDEMITGFRWHLKGAQTYYNVKPDLTTFGKAMANGFAVAALGGKREIMEIGGILDEGKERVFLTSTTHGAEMSALGAFIKTVEILQREQVIRHFWTYGNQLVHGINSIAEKHGIQDQFQIIGYGVSPNYITRDQNKDVSLAFRTLFSQEMIKQGVLMPYISLSYAHQQEELDITLHAVDKALEVYAQALSNGIDNYLSSPVIKPVFRQFN
ncbi:glutamate-1-semialdehyde 2,1-aminomutase [Pontibacter lucknowensis]|uniref:Glutamate-1-semialdehyde 2,1-aminomutase n=1 Tax=Pontibacter lucknowensis TaxID=1077936 RepID=A0A1N7ATA5_9BACT|nr:glutamate-1-semialdehyde 2,1-aminomutase [Pontibacter lucknowensis]SIR42295.1 glutamate-1-semialdehyde 2,1-aminomutase [Pontibacter lucknowensis]